MSNGIPALNIKSRTDPDVLGLNDNGHARPTGTARHKRFSMGFVPFITVQRGSQLHFEDEKANSTPCSPSSSRPTTPTSSSAVGLFATESTPHRVSLQGEKEFDPSERSMEQMVCLIVKKHATEMPNFRQVAENLGQKPRLLADYIGLMTGTQFVLDSPIPYLRCKCGTRQLSNIIRQFILDLVLCCMCRSASVSHEVSVSKNRVVCVCNNCHYRERLNETRIAARVLIYQAIRERGLISYGKHV